MDVNSASSICESSMHITKHILISCSVYQSLALWVSASLPDSDNVSSTAVLCWRRLWNNSRNISSHIDDNSTRYTWKSIRTVYHPLNFWTVTSGVTRRAEGADSPWWQLRGGGKIGVIKGASDILRLLGAAELQFVPDADKPRYAAAFELLHISLLSCSVNFIIMLIFKIRWFFTLCVVSYANHIWIMSMMLVMMIMMKRTCLKYRTTLVAPNR